MVRVRLALHALVSIASTLGHRVSVDLVIQLPDDEIPHNLPGYVEHLQDIMEEVHMEVRGTLGHSAARMKTYYDRKSDGEVYQPGDALW